MDELDYLVSSTYNTLLLKSATPTAKVNHRKLIQKAFEIAGVYAEERDIFADKMEELEKKKEKEKIKKL